MNRIFAGSRGFTLPELLVALVIAAVGLFGFAQMQYRSLLVEQEQMRRIHARLLLAEIAGHVRSADNPEFYLAGYDTPPAPGADCRSTGCSPRELARFQLAQWKCRAGDRSNEALCASITTAHGLLPRGRLSIAEAGDHYALGMQWTRLDGEVKTLTRNCVRLPL